MVTGAHLVPRDETLYSGVTYYLIFALQRERYSRIAGEANELLLPLRRLTVCT